MHNRMPSRRRQGNTVPVQGQAQTQERVPRMPHERDESADGQRSGEASGPRIGQAAHDDVERGLVDTDKGPVLDQAYAKVKKISP